MVRRSRTRRPEMIYQERHAQGVMKRYGSLLELGQRFSVNVVAILHSFSKFNLLC